MAKPMIVLLAEMKVERDAERALADELAADLERYVGLTGALARYRETRQQPDNAAPGGGAFTITIDDPDDREARYQETRQPAPDRFGAMTDTQDPSAGDRIKTELKAFGDDLKNDLAELAPDVRAKLSQKIDQKLDELGAKIGGQ